MKLIDFRFYIQSSNQIGTLYLCFSGFDFDWNQNFTFTIRFWALMSFFIISEFTFQFSPLKSAEKIFFIHLFMSFKYLWLYSLCYICKSYSQFLSLIEPKCHYFNVHCLSYSYKCICKLVLFVSWILFLSALIVIDLISTNLSSSAKVVLQSLRMELTWRLPSGPWVLRTLLW